VATSAMPSTFERLSLRPDPRPPVANFDSIEDKSTPAGGTMVASTMTEPAERLRTTCSGRMPSPALAAIALAVASSKAASVAGFELSAAKSTFLTDMFTEMPTSASSGS